METRGRRGRDRNQVPSWAWWKPGAAVVVIVW